MAGGEDQRHPNLHLSPEERRLFGQLFAAADTEKLGVVTGEVAVKFFEKTRLSPAVLGEIWQIADVENRGLLNPPGFGIVLRLIGYAQAGRPVSAELALKPGGPLPRFDGISAPTHAPPSAAPAPLQPQQSGGPIRVPPLTPDKVSQYSSLFEESGARNGVLSGETAKQIFEKAQLPNEVLGRIWNLADTEQKGELGLTEFIIAMHLLASFRNGSMRALPQILPGGLYDAASRRGAPRQFPGSRPTSGAASVNSIPRQLSGTGFPVVSSPETRSPHTQLQAPTDSAAVDWAVNPRDKENFDQLFSKVDMDNRGFITGDQAVAFFSNSRLPEDVLAQIWDLADINSEGRLNQDEFAVAMFLIRQQRNGQDHLPQTLPSNLIPPSMRRQSGAPAVPSIPANSVAVSRFASEDLFGLDDAFKSPPSKIASATGDSALYRSSPSPSKLSPQITPQPQQPATLKPFVPTSSFGQNLMTPQSTGVSTNNSSVFETRKTLQKSPFAADDLLGDNDPDVSQKLTQETTELANLSNQVSNLTSHMQEVKSKRVSTEQDLSIAQAQKRDFESRLSQLRFAYEQEAVAVKKLEEHLSSSRIEIKQLEHDLALADGTYQDLLNQHRQVAGALETDQKENLRLKERIRQTNSEINELKPQIEKTKSELRHQKGLVTINKKQLLINKSERDKLKGDLEETSKELDDTRREVEESSRTLAAKSDVSTPIPTASPTTSTNMNPFFRRVPTASSEKEVSSPFSPQGVASPNHNAFDSIFGPSISSSTPELGPPLASFRTESPRNLHSSTPELGSPPTAFRPGSPGDLHSSPPPATISTQSIKSADEPEIQTPSDSPTPTDRDGSQSGVIPPPPPQSRQMTSSLLPFRNLQRNDSTSSSVKVVPPASRMGGNSGFDTPTERPLSYSESPQQLEMKQGSEFPTTRLAALESLQSTEGALPSSGNGNTDYFFDDEVAQYLAGKDSSHELPGAFPEDSTPPAPLSAPLKDVVGPGRNSIEPSVSRADDPFGTVEENPRTPITSKDDFNAAFEGFSNKGKAPDKSNGVVATAQGAPKAHDEFPPIQDVGADEESDSDYSGHGFDDNFTTASPRRAPVDVNKTSLLSQQATEESYLTPPRPSLVTTESNQSELPTPGAQNPPPTYDQTIPQNQHEDSNHFPAEYTGLLPSREIQLSSPASPSADVTLQKITSPALNEKGSDTFGGHVPVEASKSPSLSAPTPLVPGASAAPYAYDQSSAKANQISSHPPAPPKAVLDDDFDNEFGDLSEAREADDKGDDELNSAPKIDFDEFNPIFDSPNPSKSIGYPSNTFPAENDFRDFESTVAASSQTPYSAQAPSNSKYDWDAVFAGIETPQNNGVQAEPKPGQTSSPLPRREASLEPKPPLGRGLSTGTDHDDPILKRLTAMGYPRDSSLKALEKFDYNINMAADYLTSKS